jgi:hypothetical protein
MQPALKKPPLASILTLAPDEEGGMIDMNQVVGRANVLFVTLDCLRLDVARDCLAGGRTPNLAALLPTGGWEARETPGRSPCRRTWPSSTAFCPHRRARGRTRACSRWSSRAR